MALQEDWYTWECCYYSDLFGCSAVRCLDEEKVAAEIDKLRRTAAINAFGQEQLDKAANDLKNLIEAKAEIERLRAIIHETEACLTMAVIQDGHERCKFALEKLRSK